MNIGRTFVIGSNVFREVIRERVLYLVGFFGLAFGLATRLLPEVAGGLQDKLLLDVGLAAINILGVIVAIFIGTTLINHEIEKRSVYLMMSKPISRSEFIVGKHWGLSAVLAVLTIAMTTIFFVILTAQKIPLPLPSLVLTAGFQFLELSLLAAIAILFSCFTSSLLAMLMTLGVYLMGHLSRDIVTLGKLSKNPTIEQVTQGLYLVLPDLSRFNLKNQAVYGMDLLPEPTLLMGSVGYAVVYMGLALAIAILIFSRRQF